MNYTVCKCKTHLLLTSIIFISCYQCACTKHEEQTPYSESDSTQVITEQSDSVQEFMRIVSEPNDEGGWATKLDTIADYYGHLMVEGDEEGILQILAEFGQHDANVDFAILGGGAGITISAPKRIRTLDSSIMNPDIYGISSEEAKHIKVIVAEYMLKNWAHDPYLWDRYCYFLRWHLNQYDTAISLFRTYLTMRSRYANDDYSLLTEDAYWWSARNLAYLIWITNRMDLLDNADLENLHSVCLEWNVWFEDARDHIKPDSNKLRWERSLFIQINGNHKLVPPDLPFDDWKGTIPEMDIIHEIRRGWLFHYEWDPYDDPPSNQSNLDDSTNEVDN